LKQGLEIFALAIVANKRGLQYVFRPNSRFLNGLALIRAQGRSGLVLGVVRRFPAPLDFRKAKSFLSRLLVLEGFVDKRHVLGFLGVDRGAGLLGDVRRYVRQSIKTLALAFVITIRHFAAFIAIEAVNIIASADH